MFKFFRRQCAGISRERLLDLQLEALQSRNQRRQKAAKAELLRRGVTPRVRISGGYVPPRVARVFTYTNVRGLA
jgi:hypothetical protein